MMRSDAKDDRRGPVAPPSDYQPRSDLLHGRVILVTGAGGVIGGAVARGCAAYGATVALLGRSERRLAAVYDAIVADGGADPALCPLDLLAATPDNFATLTGSIGDTLGRLDGVVHAAGMHAGLASIEHQDPRTFAATLQVNLQAPALLTRACLPLLRAAPSASVVFVTDHYGREAHAYWGAYAIAKAGTEMLMRILADELEANTAVRVNALYPGPTASPIRASVWPAENRDTLHAGVDVVPACLWLLGEDSGNLSGQSLDAHE